MNKVIDGMRPVHVAKVAGAGNKVVFLLDQKGDYYINLVPGFKNWDLCASEALIMGMHGIVTDGHQKPLIYDPAAKSYTIREGIVIAKNKKVFDLCWERVLEGTDKTISKFHEEII